ncbi:MAG: hypothetical protein UX04_C0001G0110 [Microgenomates group bacterium GW2011_GWF2_45_18]|nr:MAG: hypothetical protein UW18_C0003G0120 [Microgenomates group bacterium GW2011_GWF1_44_10]KKU02339.1 MAG: hypothetical protein UX04_C0001G0110 [Microgenomates group bacterium GW2011_GWF2_45_18]OGJ41671.1 MAG: hypothetical protein A2378_02200 [Candidatus Pacebacteria bacterium RIFOXYB1_FULL_44_10]HAU99194.1 hypothetical protein [Candidatus Paceibacterota bacterium]HAX01724.1 hypothetical protein [Candidatus Paceibacterota bacterium]
MRIGIDARLSGTKNAGIGRYIENLIRALANLSFSDEFVIFVSDISAFAWLSQDTRFRLVEVKVSHYSVLEQLVMPFVIWRSGVSLVHIPHFNVPYICPTPFVVTIHDLLWHEKKDTRATTLHPIVHFMKYAFYRMIVKHAVENARHIVVPSQVVEKIVEKYYPQHAPITVAYEGVTPFSSVHTTPHSQDPYLLCVGSLYPHKNIDRVLPHLKRHSGLHLKLASSRSVFLDRFRQKVQEYELDSRVEIIEHPSDDELAELYTNAFAFLFPSSSEGFGLPGLEAMSRECPVVCSDIPIFHEVYGDAVLYVHFDDESSFTDAMNVLKDSSMRAMYIKRGLLQSKRYSWMNHAKTVFQTYQDYD